MSMRDDYPGLTVLVDAAEDRDKLPEALRCYLELAALRSIEGRAVKLAERLQQECDAWMNGVADVVEPLGYDRQAASGPSDLLPGLSTLMERAREGAILKRANRGLTVHSPMATVPHDPIFQAGSKLCVCGEWDDDRIHVTRIPGNPQASESEGS